MQACLDHAEQLGHFVEIEIIAPEEKKTRAQAVLAEIAADLGIMEATLSGWLKAAGVPLHSRPGGRSGPPPPDGETAARAILSLGTEGNVRTLTLPAFAEDEYRKIIDSL